MNEKVEGSMGDETPEATVKHSLKKPKIIIRKFKKPSAESKAVDDSKKVNGELSTESKGKESDEVRVEEVTPKLPETRTRATKRKKSEALADHDSITQSNSTRREDKKTEEKDEKDDPSVEFKGFKKRILAQTEKLKEVIADNSQQGKSDAVTEELQIPGKINLRPRILKANRSKKKTTTNGKKSSEGDSDETQAESQTEYAQYLGLQPTMQFKCYRCGEKGFPSMLALNLHQRGCGISQKANFIANLQQDTAVSPSDPNMLTNFRITRKVYLCSACGTYYENWNLFLHMRDVHKKHICLFCLTMFGLADKLADHLKSTHSVQESSFKSSEEFQNAYKGSCYLICCTCENMFNERENYFHHQCVKRDPSAKCNLCGVRCGHYYTCPNSNNRSLPAGLSGQHSTINKAGLVGKKKATEELWMGKKSQDRSSVDTDDDYDISHAASFCHVDIADESGEKDKSASEDNLMEVAVDSERTKIDEPNNEVSESYDLAKQNKDENVLSEDCVEVTETECNKSETSVGPENVPCEESINEEETIMKKDQPNNKSVEVPETVSEEDKDKESEDNKCTDVEANEENSINESPDNNVDETSSKDDNLKESPDKKDKSEDSLLQEAIVSPEKMETEEISKKDDENSEQLPEKDKDDTASSSDTDGEPVTQLSVSQEDSESSSDESSDGEQKKDESKQSAESNKDDSVSESDDSNKPSLVSDEREKNLNIKIPEDNKTTTVENVSEDEEESIKESQSPASNEASKDFLLNEDKQTENIEKENSSSSTAQEESHDSTQEEVNDGIPLAGEDVPAMALTLEDKLEDTISQSVVKECVRTSCLNCVYCSHATKIAVNGKQLALHLLAEHRYKPVKNNETIEDVIKKLKTSLADLETLFFNTDSYDSSDKSLNTSYDYTYECFQCRFVTKIHKELYVHKRKMHQKTVLLCVMCKSNFYSYSELLCHMCPGIYLSEDINFRCCFCNLDMIPSAFRLMVHLRKCHHTCDICLEVAGDQQKLSTHMWKHKLNHLCYRCGIAYRNKPDITKHLFWKHGTESVLCKKCLQKKWRHVYHFCIPPTVFICEECNASFTKAVALKVHKRFHGGELPHGCSKCDKKFVSKKLLGKHEVTHNPPLQSEKSIPVKREVVNKHRESADDHINVDTVDEPGIESAVKDGSYTEISKENDVKTDGTSESKSRKKKKREKDRKGKPVVDVYDLPPLNLSSESDSSDEETRPSTSETPQEKQVPTEINIGDVPSQMKNEKACDNLDETQVPVPVVDGVWDNFHSYKAELEKRESKDLSLPNILPSTSSDEPKVQPETVFEEEPAPHWALMDHCYCLIPGKPKPTGSDEEKQNISEPAPAEEITMDKGESSPAPRGHSSSIDHAYATLTNSGGEATMEQASAPLIPLAPPAETQPTIKKKQKTPKKKKHNTNTNSSSSSDSSSDSDSSSCTCGTNCSCSSSSSNSSSSSSSDSESSTSEGRRKAATRREKKKERLKFKHHKEPAPDPIPEVLPPPPPPPPEEEPVVDIPVEPVELPIRESDLDTDESSTDEDFYDKYPQSHAKQQMEKRNKLMLLASVAPVNNGTVSPIPPPPEEKSAPPPPVPKRKVKTKKRRKSQQKKKSANKNISSHQIQPSTSLSVPVTTSTPIHVSTNHLNLTSKVASPLRTPVSSLHSDATAGSGSENESARLSKRKRVRNKFYGYSSGEEELERPNVKWKKGDPAPGLSFQPVQRPPLMIAEVKRPKPSESSGSEEEAPVNREDLSNNSSSSSSESEHEVDSKADVQKEQTEKSDNLYCYCQCPYDEVSEMIACDGQDCTIEWFHFECVGIMVPPKGKWYCPDCRKRRDLM